MNKSNAKIAVISLGCDKNRVDTETILYRLVSGGYNITNDYEEADIILINSCAFISSAQKECIDTVFDCNRYRSKNLKKIILTGCMPQRFQEKLIELLPEVDCFVGINDYEDICKIIESEIKYILSPHKYCETNRRILSTPPHYSYLKISEGCDNFCTYCTIPSIRGKFRSGSIEQLTNEAKFLSDMGVSELIIVAQDTTRYGIDIYGEKKLTELLGNILKKCDFVHIRMLYCYPELVDDALINFIASENRIVKYLDIPLQHISNSVLKRMGRKSSNENIVALFEKLNAIGIKVRTTFIVGFPGESEEDFIQLCEFVKKYKPYHVGIFAYSKEENTPAARMTEQISSKIKKQRVDILGGLHKQNVAERNSALVGQTLNIIYEDIDFDKNMFVGRTEYDAPEIDGLVYFSGNNVEVGNYYNVEITGFDGYDLIGRLVD